MGKRTSAGRSEARVAPRGAKVLFEFFNVKLTMGGLPESMTTAG
jgi:hypothetical protein